MIIVTIIYDNLLFNINMMCLTFDFNFLVRCKFIKKLTAFLSATQFFVNIVFW